MRVTIVNDCGYVMEDLLQLLQPQFEIEFIKRDRSFYGKTIGLAKKILQSQGQIYHVNYALQDAFIVSKTRSLDVLHCHGSDVRWTINHPTLGWMVKHNLQHAKTVLYSTPELQTILEKYVNKPTWLPNPIQTETFKPEPKQTTTPKAVYFKKWYETLPPIIPILCKQLGIELTIIPANKKIPHRNMPKLLNQFDIIVDRFVISSRSKTCLEAMSCGLCEVPVKGENVAQSLTKYAEEEYRHKQGIENRNFILNQHDVKKVANQLSEIWRSII